MASTSDSPSPPPTANLEKWQAYYTKPSTRPPWEGPEPVSYVLSLLPSLPPGARTLELGTYIHE